MKPAAESFSSVAARATRRAAGAVLLLVALWFAGASSRAEDAVTAFDQAGKLYEQGKFREAAAAYEALAANGKTSAALGFNLGNAFYRSGQLGRAIVAYRQAEQLTPRDPELQANLQFARKAAGDGAAPVAGGWSRWLGALTLNEWTALACGVGWLWFGLLTAALWRESLKRSLSGYTATAGVLFALLLGGLGATLRLQQPDSLAVVVVREAVVRHGPLSESPSYFTLRDGAEVRVLDQKDGWVQILDATRRRGWLEGKQVRPLALENFAR